MRLWRKFLHPWIHCHSLLRAFPAGPAHSRQRWPCMERVWISITQDCWIFFLLGHTHTHTKELVPQMYALQGQLVFHQCYFGSVYCMTAQHWTYYDKQDGASYSLSSSQYQFPWCFKFSFPSFTGRLIQALSSRSCPQKPSSVLLTHLKIVASYKDFSAWEQTFTMLFFFTAPSLLPS